MAVENNVRAVERALAILDCFNSSKSSFTLTELARAIDLSPSTTLRLISTLESKNYIYRNPENMRYYLGYRLAQLSDIAFSTMDIRLIARPHLERIHQEFNESIGIFLLKNNQRVCIDRIEGDRILKTSIQIGGVQPLTQGAAGKTLLAYLPEDVIRELLTGESSVTLGEIHKIREYGHTVSYAEKEPGIVSIAAPIFGSDRQITASLVISGPSARFDQYLINQLVSTTVQTASEISSEMGYIKA